jgi:hypothetical protein
VPAAAVIPAPIAYIKVAAVKKLVVGSQSWSDGSSHDDTVRIGQFDAFLRMLFIEVYGESVTFTLKKLECSKQAIA